MGRLSSFFSFLLFILPHTPCKTAKLKWNKFALNCSLLFFSQGKKILLANAKNKDRQME